MPSCSGSHDGPCCAQRQARPRVVKRRLQRRDLVVYESYSALRARVASGDTGRRPHAYASARRALAPAEPSPPPRTGRDVPPFMNNIIKKENEASYSSSQPISDYSSCEEGDYSTMIKKESKLSELDDVSTSPENMNNLLLETSQRIKKEVVSIGGFDIDCDLKEPFVQYKLKRMSLKKKGTLHKKNQVFTSTPKAALLRSRRCTQHFDNNDNSKSGNKQTQAVPNGQFEDLSNVSGISFNNISSTNLHPTKIPRNLPNKSSRTPVKESQQSTKNADNKVPVLNKALETSKGTRTAALNCSVDFSELNIFTPNTTRENIVKKVDTSTSEATVKKEIDFAEMCDKINYSPFCSPFCALSFLIKKNRKRLKKPSYDLTTKDTNAKPSPDKMIKKENAKESISRTRSGRPIRQGVREPCNSVLVVNNATEQASTMAVNVALAMDKEQSAGDSEKGQKCRGFAPKRNKKPSNDLTTKDTPTEPSPDKMIKKENAKESISRTRSGRPIRQGVRAPCNSVLVVNNATEQASTVPVNIALAMDKEQSAGDSGKRQKGFAPKRYKKPSNDLTTKDTPAEPSPDKMIKKENAKESISRTRSGRPIRQGVREPCNSVLVVNNATEQASTVAVNIALAMDKEQSAGDSGKRQKGFAPKRHKKPSNDLTTKDTPAKPSPDKMIKKENAKESISRTRSGRHIRQGVREPCNSVLVVNNATEQASTVAVNVALAMDKEQSAADSGKRQKGFAPKRHKKPSNDLTTKDTPAEPSPDKMIKKENAKESISRTRSGRPIRQGVREPSNSVLVVNNATEQASTVAVNVALAMDKEKSAGDSGKRQKCRGFAQCFSDSDGDSKPINQKKFFC